MKYINNPAIIDVVIIMAVIHPFFIFLFIFLIFFVMSKNEIKSPLLLVEISMLILFHLRALSKSSLGALIVYLRSTEGEFTEWLESNKDTLLKDVPEFADYWDKLKNS